jgi:hypothetical protein
MFLFPYLLVSLSGRQAGVSRVLSSLLGVMLVSASLKQQVVEFVARNGKIRSIT